MNYSRAIKIIRSIYELEQQELASLVDVNPSYISVVESGKKPASSKLIKKISTELGIPRSLIDLLASETPQDTGEKNKEKIAEMLLKVLYEQSR